MNITQDHLNQFQTYLLRWHQLHGRHDLPWRKEYDPYHILVSEVMLQQTQVSRVIPKFEAFLLRFPTISDLAQASPRDIIQEWQGLGYNRRGLFLQRTAQSVVEKHHGIIPSNQEELLHLPGVGPYTASALGAFAFNQPVVVIETNIRAVYIHHFFPEVSTQKLDKKNIADSDLLPLIEGSLHTDNPREWYSALMDYGSVLKQLLPNPSRRSKEYTKQSTFKGSFRQLRGSLLRQLAQAPNGLMSFWSLAEGVPKHFSQKEVELALEKLAQEGFITKQQETYSLHETD